MKRYTYKVEVSHYVTFCDDDIPEGDSPEEFAQYNWGGEFEDDYDCYSVKSYEVVSIDDDGNEV